MIQDPNLYSTIRGEAAPRPVDEYSMYSLYDGITHPATLVVLISAYLAWVNKDLVEHAVRASDGDVKSILHLLLVFLALVVGIRVIHSVYLAKRDYRQLESGFWDVILFLIVLLFTSGVKCRFVCSFSSGAAEAQALFLSSGSDCGASGIAR